MFCIVNNTILIEEEDFEVSATINDNCGSLEVACNVPSDKKVALALVSNSSKNLMGDKLYASGECIKIPLKQFNADSFTLEISDENGNAMSRYRIMRSYC